MTDDKGAGEGPYELGDKLKMSKHSFTSLETDIKTAIANAAHAEGRKAERERCLEIVKRHRENCDGVMVIGCAAEIEYGIRGGQDGE